MSAIRPIRRSLLLPTALLALALLAAGCLGDLSQPSPGKRYYTLNPLRNDGPLVANPVAKRLKIRRLTAASSYESRELVYKLEDGGFVTDYYHLFLAPPADQVSQAMIRWLRDAKLFDAVLPPSSSTGSLYILETSIDELYADYSVDPPQAVARLHTILLKDDGVEYSVVMDRAYSGSVTVEGQGAPAVVKAMEKAFASMFRNLEQDLAVRIDSIDD